jgi:hypothetical protein
VEQAGKTANPVNGAVGLPVLPLPPETQNFSRLTLSSALHPNELFRFVQLRSPRPPEYEAENIIRYPSIGRTEKNPFYAELLVLQNNFGTTSAPSIATTLSDPAVQTNYQFIATEQAFNQIYTNILKFETWLDRNRTIAQFTDVSDAFLRIFGISMPDYASNSLLNDQLQLWDNLLMRLFIKDKVCGISLFCKALAVLHLVDYLANSNNTANIVDENQTLNRLYTTQVLIPSWIWDIILAQFTQADNALIPPTSTTPNSDPNNYEDSAVIDILKAISNITGLPFNQYDGFTPVSTNDLNWAVLNNSTQQILARHLNYSQSLVNTANTDNSIPNITIAGTAKTLWQHAMLLQGLVNIGNAEGESWIGNTLMSNSAVNNLLPPFAEFDVKEGIKTLGFDGKGTFMSESYIADLLVTKQQLVKYDLGDVADIEKIMSGEKKTHTFRQLDRTETVNSWEHDTSTETEEDNQTTERFSMEREAQNVLDQHFQANAGVNATFTYGTTASLNAHADVSYGTSQHQATNDATHFSKEVTSRAIKRFKERIRESKVVTVLHETEETSLHSFENLLPEHINGVYCFVDKIVLNKIVNHGKRLMLDFYVPEPANFYLYSRKQQNSQSVLPPKPVPPSLVTAPNGRKLTNFREIDELNYAFWCALYDVEDAEQAPEHTKMIIKTFKQQTETKWESAAINDFVVPEGYEAINIYFDTLYSGTDWHVEVIAGSWLFTAGTTDHYRVFDKPITGSIPVIMRGHDGLFSISLTCNCRATRHLVEKWQMQTYEKIITGYNRKKMEYDEAVKQATYDQADYGNNPLFNREIERNELKRSVLELYTGQRFESNDAAVSGITPPYPEFLFGESRTEGTIFKLLEQAFEWDNINYIFYPYFYGRKANWAKRMQLTDKDTLFQKFLQAGYARVVVPVRPGFERLAMLYSWLPQMINCTDLSGTWVPGIDNPLHQAIADELKESGMIVADDKMPIVAHYVEKVPTNFVYLAHINDHLHNDLPDNSNHPSIQGYI